MTNSKQSSDDTFERLASGRSARPASSRAKRRTSTNTQSPALTPAQAGHGKLPGEKYNLSQLSSRSTPPWAFQSPEAQPSGRSLVQAVAAAQQEDPPTPQRPVSPTGEAANLLRRRLDILEAQNERLQEQIVQLRQEQEERDGVAATAEAVLLQLQGQVEAVLDATQGPQKEIEDRVLSTEACHKLRRLCQASHSRLKQTLKTAAEADVCSHQQRGVVTPPTLFQRSASGPTQQDHSQDLQQLSRDVRQQMQTLAPSLLQFSVTLRSDVLPSLRAATVSSKNALLAKCAAVAQNCSDVAEKSLQIIHNKHQQGEHDSCIQPNTTSRAAVAAQGRRHRQQLAAQARAATDASTPSWQPQLCGLLQQSSEQACAHSTPVDSQAGTCEVAVGDAVRDSLRFSAARAEANERFIQDLAVAVEEVLEKHTRADSEAADSAVEGIGRFLEFADTAHSRPNESSIKQLVVASRVCAPAIQAAQELLAQQDIPSVKAGRELQSRLGALKQALDSVLCDKDDE